MPSYLVLARKYRPVSFSDVVGQDHIVQTLTNSIVSGRIAHAFLFCGVRGVGKTTVARILAKALNCTQKEKSRQADPCNKCASCREITDGISVDVQEIDGASHTSVENIREINENIKYPPVSSPYKIIIIDEVHMISINAFNALLKTLEEPPPHAKFIFATTEAHKVPATINSRCQRFNFRTISVADMTRGMARILAQEGLESSEEALTLVAREAQGSFRDALSLLDQVIAFGTGKVTPEDVVATLGIAGREAFGHLVKGVLDRDAASCLRLVHELFRQGYDPEQLALDLIHYLRNLIVVRTVELDNRPEGIVDATLSELDELEQLAGESSIEDLQNIFGMLVRGEAEIKRSGNPWVSLEMAVLRMAHAPNIVDLSDIIKRIPATQSPAVRPAEAPRPAAAVAPASHRPTKQAQKPQGPVPEETVKSPEPPANEGDTGPSEHFVITDITPVPAGTPDELWAMIKTEITTNGIDPAVGSIMDHGNLIFVGPTEVEIGFTKAFYKEQFERRFKEKPALKKVFQNFFGEARLKILTLARPTSLDVGQPYPGTPDDETDRNRALKQEALDHPIVRAIQKEFDESSIEDIKILPRP